jgi:RNA polymerase primary sigma factor
VRKPAWLEPESGIADAIQALVHDYRDDTDLEFIEPADLEGRAAVRERARPQNDEIGASWIVKGGDGPLLTAAEEVVLARKIEQGDQRAKDTLVNANIRLVASIARRYQGRGLPLEDLMQEGLIGLIRAAEKFNFRKGYRFSTYSTFWIRQAITRGIANQGRPIRLPAHVVDSLGRISRIKEELTLKLHRAPTRRELAEAAGLTEGKLVTLLKSAAQPLSLDAPIGADADVYVADFVPAGDESSPEITAMAGAKEQEMRRVLSTLTERERDVVVLRFGLFSEEPHTLQETGNRLQITRERARQIEARALEKLRESTESRSLLEVAG